MSVTGLELKTTPTIIESTKFDHIKDVTDCPPPPLTLNDLTSLNVSRPLGSACLTAKISTINGQSVRYYNSIILCSMHHMPREFDSNPGIHI